ncbi:MAG: hypothetical protein GX022_09680 [Clostridiaceae bacterium]|nr:hypothetical protein [Clostridiaceae bacterium]
MNRKILAICLAVLILFMASGCQLALEDKGEHNNRDRLVGVLITDEYLDLFDMEGYLKDNFNKYSSGGIINTDNADSKYQERLYATLKTRTLKDDTGKTFETREFVFDNVEGIPYFSVKIPPTENEVGFTASASDEAISDGHVSIHEGDNEEKTSLEGTIYVAIGQGTIARYINPVYQSADGSVYAISGKGISLAGEQGEGASFTQTLEETTTVTENGNSKTISFNIKISLKIMIPPEKIVIIQMDKNSNIILKDEYSPGKLPNTITPGAEVDYIIVESLKRDSEGNLTSSRSIYDRRNQNFETFYCRDDGICVKQWTNLDWDNN